MSHRHGSHLPPREDQALEDCGTKRDCYGIRGGNVSRPRRRAMGNLDWQARTRSRHAPRRPFRFAMAFLVSLSSAQQKTGTHTHLTNAILILDFRDWTVNSIIHDSAWLSPIPAPRQTGKSHPGL